MELHEIDYKVPNGKLIRLRAELDGDKICSVKIMGDFFLYPEDKIFLLEKNLIGQKPEKVTLQKIVEKTLAGCEMAGISIDELVNALLKLRTR